MKDEKKNNLFIDGLTKDDWELTLNEMKSVLNQNKIQRAALVGSIVQVEKEIARFGGGKK